MNILHPDHLKNTQGTHSVDRPHSTKSGTGGTRGRAARRAKAMLAALVATVFAALPATASPGGKFYGVHWDGAQEHFVTLDPVTGVHTSLAVVPGVQWIDATFRVFAPDSGLFGFIGGGQGGMKYQVIDVVTGTVTHAFPRNDNLKNAVYDPGTGLLYGTWWRDSTPVPVDSLGHPVPGHHEGTEYFSAIDPLTGVRTDTPIPDVQSIVASSQFLDTDSGRYVFQGMDRGGPLNVYVVDVATGSLLAKIPLDMRLDFPVYNPVLKAVHGLWWSDSTVRSDDTARDSLGFPLPLHPPALKGAEYFVTVHQDSSLEMVELPGVKYIANFNRTLDTDNGRYVFTGSENGGTIRYYVIDVATGAILSNAAASGRPVDHIVYAPLASSAYTGSAVALRQHAPRSGGLIWNLRQEAGHATLSFVNPGGSPHAFALADMNGKTLLRRDGVRTESVDFSTEGLKAGLYAFTLRNASGHVTGGKIVLK